MHFKVTKNIYNLICLILRYVHKPEFCLVIRKVRSRVNVHQGGNLTKGQKKSSCLNDLYKITEMRVISLVLFQISLGLITAKATHIVYPRWKPLESIEVSDNRIIKEHERLNI